VQVFWADGGVARVWGNAPLLKRDYEAQTAEEYVVFKAEWREKRVMPMGQWKRANVQKGNAKCACHVPSARCHAAACPGVPLPLLKPVSRCPF
jgi:hypothetical protein